MDTLEFNPASTRQAVLPQDWPILQALRRHATLRQPATPAQELHTEETSALHFITFVQEAGSDKAVACASIREDGLLYDLSVLPEYRQQQNGSALLRYMFKHLPATGIQRLSVDDLSLQTENTDTNIVKQFLNGFGFQYETEPSTNTQQFCCHLAPDRSHLQSGSELITLNNHEDFRHYYLQLIKNAKKRIAIFSLDLEATIFNNEDMQAALLAFIQYSRYTEARLLVKDTQKLMQHSHRIVQLYQRSHNQLQIRKLTVNPESQASAYLLCDDQAIVFRKDESFYQGVCYLDNRGRVKSQLEEFDLLWHAAVTDPELKRLSL